MAVNYPTITLTPATADDDSVFQNQTPAGAGALTLNGVDVSGGVWTAPDGLARTILFTTAANESAKTITITGFVDAARTIEVSETITGPNATTGSTVYHYVKITSVTVSAAFTGNVKAGFATTNDCVRIIGYPYTETNVGVSIDISGTIDYTLEHTSTDVFARDRNNNRVSAYTAWAFIPNSDVTGATVDTEVTYVSPVRALRVLINSYTFGATVNININSPDTV